MSSIYCSACQLILAHSPAELVILAFAVLLESKPSWCSVCNGCMVHYRSYSLRFLRYVARWRCRICSTMGSVKQHCLFFAIIFGLGVPLPHTSLFIWWRISYRSTQNEQFKEKQLKYSSTVWTALKIYNSSQWNLTAGEFNVSFSEFLHPFGNRCNLSNNLNVIHFCVDTMVFGNHEHCAVVYKFCFNWKCNLR